jgi:hypothetical protein
MSESSSGSNPVLQNKARTSSSITGNKDNDSIMVGEPILTNWTSLPDECQREIVDFAGRPNELCALDQTNSSFERLTEDVWSRLAMDRFGIQKEYGKLAWRQGIALTKPKKYEVFELHEPPEYEYLYGGSPVMAANESILVIGSDCYSDDLFVSEISEHCPITFRDAKSLNFMRLRPSLLDPWIVCVCGPVGAEVVAFADQNQLVAQQGSRSVRVDLAAILSDEPATGPDVYRCGIKLLGSETHLIALYKRFIVLFRPDSERLLTYVLKIPLFAVATPTREPILCWACLDEPNTFALSLLHGKINVWEILPDAHQVQHVTDIVDESICKPFDGLAVSKRFVVGSPGETKRIRIYDKKIGCMLHDLCDVTDEEEMYAADAMIYGIQMEAIGDLLVSSSYKGCALCVWQMRTGSLLCRYEDSFKLNISEAMPDGVDIASMVQLRGWGHSAFVTFDCSIKVWAFPEDAKGVQLLKHMKRRNNYQQQGYYASSSSSDSDEDPC